MANVSPLFAEKPMQHFLNGFLPWLVVKLVIDGLTKHGGDHDLKFALCGNVFIIHCTKKTVEGTKPAVHVSDDDPKSLKAVAQLLDNSHIEDANNDGSGSKTEGGGDDKPTELHHFERDVDDKSDDGNFVHSQDCFFLNGSIMITDCRMQLLADQMSCFRSYPPLLAQIE